MLSFILVAQIAVALLGFLVGKALRQSREITAAFVLIATFGNVGNFGLPLIVFRLGESARTYATVYFVATIFISFVICVGVAQGFTNQKAQQSNRNLGNKNKAEHL
jgi:hypothetical protein